MKNVLKSVEKIEKELELIKQAVLEGGQAEEAGEVDLDNLDSLKLDELKKIATDAGIEMGKKPTKKTLIEAILAFYADEDEEDDEDEDDSEDDESDDDEDEDEEGEDEEYSQEDLEELSDEELLEVAEDFEVDPAEYQKKKGKKKVLDRDALIEAILDAQGDSEDEDEDDDEDESDEDSLEFLDDDELEALKKDELQAHYDELVEYCKDEKIKLPKGAKLKDKAKDKDIRKAIVAIYDLIEESEEE